MTETVLLNNGYRQFEVPAIEKYASRFFQKKIKDKKGIKYFISVYEYKFMDTLNYEFNLVTHKDKFWINTTLYSIDTMTIEEIEQEIEDMWKKCKFNYYETFEEDNGEG